ncbi:uncharacterized protein LOC114531514 [Dendronephthya gigantea]|uniref:uncharacterized protein LOC114531514 n=1 Tax=Dendronephthya gigantea TaxID=151771 RepID=UPI00106CB901|nr:uncharacterized protein LOC114531514 [Dendronephthya gigantea]
MTETQDMPLCNEVTEATDDFESDFESQEMFDLGDKWLFPKASEHLATVLKPGVVRPLSPTLEVNAPGEDVFPGIAMLYEGFDDMLEWRNTIRFVGFFVRKENMFDNRHHWNMRTKFLEVRVRCMEKILEDPFAKHRKPEGGFFIRIPVTVKKSSRSEAGDVIAQECVGANDGHSDKRNSEMVESGNLHEGKIDENGGNSASAGTGVDGNVARCEEVQDYASFAIHGCDVESMTGEDIMLVGQDSEGKIDGDGNSTLAGIDVDGNRACCDKETAANVVSKKENIRGEVENKEERKSQPEIVRKDLDTEENTESQCILPCQTSGHYDGRNECLRDLVVVGKAIEVTLSSAELVGEAEDPALIEGSNLKNQLKEYGSKSEAWSCSVQDELILEDINDKDLVPDAIFSSSAKLGHTGVEDNPGAQAAVTSTTSKTFGKSAIQQQRRLSRFQRLRRSLGTLFSCFGKNKVTPVNIGLS